MKIICHGREELAPGHDLPRHRHLEPYAIVMIRGRFDQVGYAGRVCVQDGDLLVQPTLDSHANAMPAARGATILRLPWPDGDDLGGVFALPDPDAIIRAAERDPREAAERARAQWRRAAPRAPASDLPDQLAAALAAGTVPSLADWAALRGVARETASREFSAAFGVPARQFRAELKARAAWLQIVRTREPLARIAALAGFADQAHMTRAIRTLTGGSPAAWRRDHRAAGFAQGWRRKDGAAPARKTH